MLTAVSVPAAISTDGDGLVSLRFINIRDDSIGVVIRGCRSSRGSAIQGIALNPHEHLVPRERKFIAYRDCNEGSYRAKYNNYRAIWI